MADLENLLLGALSDDTQKAIALENPYYQFKTVPDTLSKDVSDLVRGSAAKDPDRYGLGEIALASGVTGLLSALLGAKGRDYQGVLENRYVSALQGKPTEETLPGALSR